MSKEKPENSVETLGVKEQQAVTAEEFKQHSEILIKGVLVELPESKLSVRLRKPSMMRVFRSGVMPTDLIRKLQNADGIDLDSSDVDPTLLAQNMRAMDYLIADAFVQPKMVVENPSGDEISIDYLSDTDRTFVYSWVQKDVKEMEPFRNQSRVQGAGHGGKKVRKKTK